MTSSLVRLRLSRAEASAVSALLETALDLEAVSLASFESADPATWLVEVYGPPELAGEALLERVSTVLAEAGLPGEPELAALEERDWVAASLEGLAPVRAGRVVVHGSHDRTKVRANEIGIEIEAALAFGTGHHGTTRGCLLMLQRILRGGRPRAVLDIGTGTGVLAIAAARLAHRRVLASDIDPVAVATARANGRANGAGGLVEFFEAKGLDDTRLRRARFDLILANILAEPLVGMATGLSRRLAPGGTLVLSGLLLSEERRLRAAYRARGLVLRDRIALDGWVTLAVGAPRGRA